MSMQVSIDLLFDQEATEESAGPLLQQFRAWAKVNCPEAAITTRIYASDSESPMGVFRTFPKAKVTKAKAKGKAKGK